MPIDHSTEFIVIGVYLLIIISVGFVFDRFNRNTDDYFRGGCRTSWWMVGMSSFMQGFSAWTFTAAAGVAFAAGWSVTVFYLANAVGFVVAFFLAPWFRQLRIAATTEVDRLRYSEAFAQFSSVLSALSGPIYSALQIYGLSMFAATVFGYDVNTVIIVLGAVAVVYSALGGVWGVMATDFLQGMILLPVTVFIAVACLHEVGGISGLFAEIEAQGLKETFQVVKPDGAFPQGAYTWFWVIAIFITNGKNFVMLGNASRYAAVKDGREARKAAITGAVLFLFGAFIWCIPPMVARLLYEAQVMASPAPKPAESAYVIAALNVLPAGLIGILSVAVFSATLSSLDTGLNRQSAIVVRVIYPGICRLFNLTPMSDRGQLHLSRTLTLMLGAGAVALAVHFANLQGTGLFELMLKLMAFMVGMAVPGLLGLFVRNVPSWAPFVAIAAGAVTALLGLYSKELFGESWSFQVRALVNLFVASAAFLATIPFYRYAPESYRRQVDAFFSRMKTPVDFETEVGNSSDHTQLKIMGAYTALIGFLVVCLAALPDSGLMATLIGGTMLLCGGFMWWLGRRLTTPAT